MRYAPSQLGAVMVSATKSKEEVLDREAEENLFGFLLTLVEIDQEQNTQQKLFTPNPNENND